MYVQEIILVVFTVVLTFMVASQYFRRKDVVAKIYLNEFCGDANDLVEVIASCSYPDWVREVAFSQLLKLDSRLLCKNLNSILEAVCDEEVEFHENLLHMITEQIYELIVLHLTRSDRYDEEEVLSLVYKAGQSPDMIDDLSDLLLGYSNAVLSWPYDWLSPLIFGCPEIDDEKRRKLIEKIFDGISEDNKKSLAQMEEDYGESYDVASRNLLREKLGMVPIS